MFSMVTVEIQVKPELRDEFEQILRVALPETRAYDGCQLIELYEDPGVKGRFLIYERWDSLAHQKKYMAWRTETGMMDAMAKYVAAPPIFTDWVSIDA